MNKWVLIALGYIFFTGNVYKCAAQQHTNPPIYNFSKLQVQGIDY